MAESKKIAKSDFKTEWKSPQGKVVYYHDVTFEGEDKSWNIGAQSKNPDFLNVGQTLTYEVRDAAKRSIKRVQQPFAPAQQGGGSQKYNPLGQIIGASVNNAVLLAAHGKISMDDLRKTAKGLVDFNIELQKSYEGS